MAITIEIDGYGLRVVDTSNPNTGVPPLRIKQSISVTTWSRKRVTIANSVSDQAVQFDSVTAAKVVALVSDGEISYKINAGSATPCENTGVHVSADGDITSLTISNSSGTTVNVEVLIGG